MQRRTLAPVLAGLIFSIPGVASAHFNLLMPPPADNATDGGKGAPPCGPTTPSNVVTAVQGGHPLAISLVETVLHPGHYRFALSINSRSEIPADPAVVVDSSGNSVSGAFESPAVFPVLADDVFDHTTGTVPISWQTNNITLPNITCAKCTLQVIEFMAEHPLNPGGGYYYHHCADLAITADPSLPVVTDAGATTATGTGGGAGTSGAGGSSGGHPAAKSGCGCAIPGADGGAPASVTLALLTTALLASAAYRRRRRHPSALVSARGGGRCSSTASSASRR